jgi:hypothetical protein
VIIKKWQFLEAKVEEKAWQRQKERYWQYWWWGRENGSKRLPDASVMFLA